MNKAKQKGSNGEYEVIEILQKVVDEVYASFNEKMRRVVKEADDFEGLLEWIDLEVPRLKRNLTQTQQAIGGSGSDIDGLDWLAVEVKRQENDSSFNGWWIQCRNAAVKKDDQGNQIVVNGAAVFEREPVLFSRKNRCPWDIRMLGYLAVDGDTGNGMLRCPVDINLQSFLIFFRMRLECELRKSDGILKKSVKRESEEGGALAPNALKSHSNSPNSAQITSNLSQGPVNQEQSPSIPECAPCTSGEHWKCLTYLSSGGVGGKDLKSCCC